MNPNSNDGLGMKRKPILFRTKFNKIGFLRFFRKGRGATGFCKKRMLRKLSNNLI
ncbi:MAG: hypothetical protein BWY28_02626 [bacterium ADurb.Bin236]|nr:MAG: hypothetical protein BWY28_02626 [bacterium ADurb.Bin236]